MGREKVEAPKTESPLWQVAFKMSKQEVRETIAEDFRNYMTSAHFDIGRVRREIREQNKGALKQGNSYSEKVKGEFELFKSWSMNTVYNFYSEGVLKESILRLQSGVEENMDRRVQVYIALFCSVLLYGLYDSRRQRVAPQPVVAHGDDQ